MRVLVACEFSGVVREAFRKHGHDAWSCDILPSASPSPYHIRGPVEKFLNPGCFDEYNIPPFDLMVAHPPCTYLAVSGARWWANRQMEQIDAVEFFWKLWNAPIDQIAMENPIGVISRLRKPDQIIQPWQFGHGETKATCLWLKNLPKLKPTNIVEGRKPRVHYESPGVVNGLTRQQGRSITLQGIADAMAEQWGRPTP